MVIGREESALLRLLGRLVEHTCTPEYVAATRAALMTRVPHRSVQEHPRDDVRAGVPTGWTPLSDGIVESVLTNYRHQINQSLADRLRQGGCYSQPSAMEFNGRVWFAAGRWYEQVWVRNQPVTTYSADLLEELFVEVNDRHGWT